MMAKKGEILGIDHFKSIFSPYRNQSIDLLCSFFMKGELALNERTLFDEDYTESLVFY